MVQGFHAIGYGIVANSRSIGASDIGHDPTILVGADIGSADTRRAITRFGRIDTVVNNAGVFIPKP
jgi:NAD(P)-dependent dehydrogenase (short-subunit alcohol dehydrogenase family)